MKYCLFKYVFSLIFVFLLIIGIFFSVFPNVVFAEDLVEGDFTYTVNDGVATITGYLGSAEIVEIPVIVGGYQTSHIGDFAFEDCNTINSVIIPDSIITIGRAAFSYCTSLTSIVIPDSIITIGNGAFDSCTSINSVIIGDNVTTIGDFAFISCVSMSSMTIGGSVTIIGDYAFDSCFSLTFLTIPDSVTKIGYAAFYDCHELTSVYIGSNVSTIEDYVFQYCSSLTVINVSEANANYASYNGVLYNKDLTFLIQCPAGKAGTINIPDGVTNIGYNAFYKCSALTDVTIPGSVTIIGKAAFFSCTNLTSILIPENVDSIGDYAFSYCSLTSINIPNNVITIGAHSFSHNPLTSVTIGINVTGIGNYAFKSCTSLNSITFLGLVTPYTVGQYWIEDTNINIRGHAYATSNFPAPGNIFNGLKMGAYISENSPPVFDMPIPVNDSMGNTLSFNWSIPINDPEGNNFNWNVHCNNGQSSNAYGDSNGLKSLSLFGLEHSTTYTVWVNATDTTPEGSGLYTREWYTFTTLESGNNPPVFPQAPSPVNGSNGNPLSLNWSLKINDLEGDYFSWTVQCSNGQTSTGTGENNGTKSLQLSGLSYSTKYKIWVNVTDSEGSGKYTRKWYIFTTKSSPGDGGNGGNGGDGVPPSDENKKPIADASAGEPYHGFINSEIVFDGSRSSDRDGNITKWQWDFGDENNGTGKTILHTYTKAGTYVVNLTVTDNEGATNTYTTQCIISQKTNRPPTKPSITGTIKGTINTVYEYTVSSRDADNDMVKYTFDWGESSSKSQSSEFMPSGKSYKMNHSWTTPGQYVLIVTVTDGQTESNSTLTIEINAGEKGTKETPGFELVVVILAIALIFLFKIRKIRF
jgi:PKD repeat protein